MVQCDVKNNYTFHLFSDEEDILEDTPSCPVIDEKSVTENGNALNGVH